DGRSVGCFLTTEAQRSQRISELSVPQWLKLYQLSYDQRAFVDEARVDLNEVRPRRKLRPNIITSENATNSDERIVRPMFLRTRARTDVENVISGAPERPPLSLAGNDRSIVVFVQII